MTTFLAFATDPKLPLPSQLAWMVAVYRERHGQSPAAVHARSELAARLDTDLRVVADERVPLGAISFPVSAHTVEEGGAA